VARLQTTVTAPSRRLTVALLPRPPHARSNINSMVDSIARCDAAQPSLLLLSSRAARCAENATSIGRSFSAAATKNSKNSNKSANVPCDDSSQETHSDFLPKKKAATSTDSVEDMIKQDITNNQVFVYMKGTPEQPRCGFSRNVCVVLNTFGVKFGARDVLSDERLRQGIKDFTGWPTIPQLFIAGEFIGGSDIVTQMFQSGDLQQLLKNKGLIK